MEMEFDERGITLLGASGHVRLGPAMPAATITRDGVTETWAPTLGQVHPGARLLRAVNGSGDLTLELEARTVDEVADSEEPSGAEDPEAPGTSGPDGTVEVAVRLSNTGRLPVSVERLSVLRTGRLGVGEDPRRWRIYRNGYQSWAGTRTLGVDDRDADLPTRMVRVGGTDAKHPAPNRRGHVRSDALSVVCEPFTGDAIGIAHLDLAHSFGFVEVVAPGGVLERLDVWSDLDGIQLRPGDSVRVRVRARAATGQDAGWRVFRSLALEVGAQNGARGVDQEHPGGWCSWYYYFTKVTESDVRENLQVLAGDARRGPRFCADFVMVDDGHQSMIGDWLDTDPEAFPSGMADLSDRIRAAGFDAGIWWAPFLVHPSSRTAAEHPEWLVRNERGRPIMGGLNPMWSLRTPMHVLDTTHPEVLDHLGAVASQLAEWGYRIQKLDFLYAAALPGVRHDGTATRAMALRRGLDAVRSGAGEESFLLGCGSPLGPAVGVVDAMRIGADVTPYWSSVIDRVGGRGIHGLATRNAVMNILTRAALDGAWWLNDPDCLMVRDTDTKLDEEEVRVLATVIGITNGMVVLSDRLAKLSDRRTDLIARTHELRGGRVEVLDLFERGMPELVVSRHGDHVDVAVLNLEDRARHRRVALHRRGVTCPDGEVEEFWTGARVPVRSGVADLGVLPAHSARVLRIATTR